jgi:hypothetical protein
MAFGRKDKTGVDTTAAEEHHRSLRRKVMGYLLILVAVFIGVMAVLAFFIPTQTTVGGSP